MEQIRSQQLGLIDLIQRYNIKISVEGLLNLCDTLKPRIYTIASSAKAHPECIHMTISLVRDVL